MIHVTFKTATVTHSEGDDQVPEVMAQVLTWTRAAARVSRKEDTVSMWGRKPVTVQLSQDLQRRAMARSEPHRPRGAQPCSMGPKKTSL